MAGLDANGFEIKTFEEIREEMRQDVDVEFGASNMSRYESSTFNFLISIVAMLAAVCWQLAQTVYASQSPNTAFGVLLDNVLALTGLRRLGATYSTVSVVCVGTNATVLAAGRRLKNAVTGTFWASDEAATIVTVSSWASSTVYARGALLTNSGSVYVCVTAGTSHSSGGPTGTGASISDGTAAWRYCGAGTAAVAVEFTSEVVGPIVAAAGDLTSIQTPQGGWTSAINSQDAAQGRLVESDAQARNRRNESLASTGNAALDAIVADVRRVEGVDKVICFQNETDATDGDGLPPHSVEVLVRGGADADIAAALLGTVAAGIQTHGDESDVAIDSNGTSHTMYFSRPESIDVYIDVDVEIDADTFPSDGDAQIEQALVDFTQGLEVNGYTFGYGVLDIGDDVIANVLIPAVMQIDGVVRVDEIRLSTTPGPTTSADVVITNRQQADIDTSRIEVTHV